MDLEHELELLPSMDNRVGGSLLWDPNKSLGKASIILASTIKDVISDEPIY